MGKVSVYCIENRVAVKSLLGLVFRCAGEAPEPEFGNQTRSVARKLEGCI